MSATEQRKQFALRKGKVEMQLSTFVKRTLVVALVMVPFAAGEVLAERGERGRGEGRGGGEGRGFSARSFDGGQRPTAPSFHRGDNRSRPSFSRGDDIARSFSERRMAPSIQRGPSFQPSTRDVFRSDRSNERSISPRGLSIEQRLPRGLQFDQTRREHQVQRPPDIEPRNFQFQRSETSRRADVEDTLRRGFQPNRAEPLSRRRNDEAEREPRDVRRFFQQDSNESFTRRSSDEANREFRDDRDHRTRVGERSLRDTLPGNQQFLRDRRDLGKQSDNRLTEGRPSRERQFRDSPVEREYHRWRDVARLEGKRVGDERDWSGRWREGDRFQVAHRIRDEWRKGDRDRYPFRHDWWDRHNGWRFWGHYGRRFDGPWYWWTWVTAPRLSAWISFGWPTYYYWDYGPGEYIYCRDNVIYVNGRWYAPAPVFYERTVRLVEEAPDLTAEKAAQLEWLPLGVFAVSHDGEAKVEVLVQLAVTPDGVIGGTAFDQSTGAAYPIEGVVEQKTQRTVWSFTKDGRRVLMETSLFNLTQPEATGLVHYGPDDIRVIQLVRLEAPDNAGKGAVPAEGELPAPTENR